MGLIDNWITKLTELTSQNTHGYVDISKLSTEEREKAFIKFGEGCPSLTKLLNTAYDHNVESMFCCSGHGITNGYVVFIVDENNLNYLQTVGKILSNYNITTNFENHHILGKRVSFSEIADKPTDWFSIANDVMANPEKFDSNPSRYYHETMYDSYIPLDYKLEKWLLNLLNNLNTKRQLLTESNYTTNNLKYKSNNAFKESLHVSSQEIVPPKNMKEISTQEKDTPEI